LNRDRLAEAFLLIRSLAGRDGAERQGQNSHAGQALCNAVIRAVAACGSAASGLRDPLRRSRTRWTSTVLEHRQGLSAHERPTVWQRDWGL